MATFGRSGDGAQEKPEFSLTRAVEDVSQHGCALTEALAEEKKTLSTLQAVLSDVEKKCEMAEQELKSKEREYLMLEAKMEHLEQRTKDLHDHCASICKDKTELQTSIREKEGNAGMSLERFKIYRDKMERHRAALLHVESKTVVYKKLEEKRSLAEMVRKKREELEEDLENPFGSTVQMAKREIAALEGEITLMKKSTAKKREQLQKVFETQAQLKKTIEIQNRRYEAIIKHLHCQINRAKAERRQMSEEVDRMERELSELKGQLESSQDSSVSGQ